LRKGGCTWFKIYLPLRILNKSAWSFPTHPLIHIALASEAYGSCADFLRAYGIDVCLPIPPSRPPPRKLLIEQNSPNSREKPPAPTRQNDCQPNAGLQFDLVATGDMEVVDGSRPEWTFQPTANRHFCRVKLLRFGLCEWHLDAGPERRSAGSDGPRFCLPSISSCPILLPTRT